MKGGGLAGAIVKKGGTTFVVSHSFTDAKTITELFERMMILKFNQKPWTYEQTNDTIKLPTDSGSLLRKPYGNG